MSYSKIIHGIVGATSVGLVVMHALPNLYPNVVLEQYEIQGLQIPDHVKTAFEDAAKQMDLKYPEKVQLFINNGFGTVSVGSTLLPGGAAVGISRTFLHNCPEDLENSGITFQGRRLNWKTKAGNKLKESLLFEKDELRFILAHEISHIKNWDFTTNCFLPAWWLYFTYRAVPIVILSLPPLNPLIKITIQVFICLVSYWMYTYQNISLHHNREFVADSTAAMIGLDYMKGGISATLKRMNMNCILRSLNGEEGAKLYSIDGNDLKDWAHPKLSERLRKLENLYAEHYIKNAD